MKFNSLPGTVPSSVRGIFIFSEEFSTRYEENDIVLYDNKLYIVNNDCTDYDYNDGYPDHSSYFTEYIKQLSINDQAELVDGGINRNMYLPVNMLQGLFNQYMKGLHPLGVTEELTEGDLNNITTNSTYFIRKSNMSGGRSVAINNTPQSIISSDDLTKMCLFRCYSLYSSDNNPYIIQEIIDIDNTVMYIRRNPTSQQDTSWSPWTSAFGTSQTAANIHGVINQSINNSRDYYEKVYNTLTNSMKYYSYIDISAPELWSGINSFPYAWSMGSSIAFIPQVPLLDTSLNLVKFIGTYELEGENHQEIITMYLDDGLLSNEYSCISTSRLFKINTMITTVGLTFELVPLDNTLSEITVLRILSNVKKNFIINNDNN